MYSWWVAVAVEIAGELHSLIVTRMDLVVGLVVILKRF